MSGSAARLASLAAVAAMLGVNHGAAARPAATLWVVQPPGEIVAFEPSDLSRVGGVRIPPPAFHDPGRIALNGAGQLLIHLDDEHLWLWDGAQETTLAVHPRFPGMDSTEARAPRRWLLGNDGASLYDFLGPLPPQGSASDTAGRRWILTETDLAQRPRHVVFDRRHRTCHCPLTLLAGSEPCPDPDLWAPRGVVDDVLLLTHWRQESLGEEAEGDMGYYQALAEREQTLYRRAGPGWQVSELGPGWGDLMDLSGNSPTAIWKDEDSGCCGWSNESSERAWLTDADTSIILFDEWPRFHNQDYDVSFYPHRARIAPGGKRAAYGVAASATAFDEIRVSGDGDPDPAALDSVRRELSQLPMVEVHDLGSRPTLVLRLMRAELVDWLSESELVVVERRRLVVVDVTSRRRRESGIEVRSPADAIVVRR